MTKQNNNKTTPKSSAPVMRKNQNNRNNNRVPRGLRLSDGRYSAPAASTRVVKTEVARISGSPYSGDGKITVKHREYIGEIPGSVAFSAVSYSINPALATTFQWLSTLASNYESYKFRNLRFEFETEKSSSTAGSLMMAVDFDAADAAPTTKQAMMTFQNAVRSAPWCPCEYSSSGPDLIKFGVQRYLRSAALAANLDIKTYDVGNLIVATSGCADTSTLGELYVSYEVELHTPQQGVLPLSAFTGEKIVGAGSVSKTAIFGSTPTITGTTAWSAVTNTLTCVIAGDYLLELDVIGTTLVLNAAPTGTATITAAVPQNVLIDTTGVYGLGAWAVRATVGQTIIFNMSNSATLTSSNARIGSYTYTLA